MAQSSINSSELISTVNELAKERRVNKDVLFSAIEAALISAYKKNYGKGANVRASIDRDKGEIEVLSRKTVVEEVTDPQSEMTLQEARDIDRRYAVGDLVEVPVSPRDFGRIAAQTAKKVVVQHLREAERGVIYDEYSQKENARTRGWSRACLLWKCPSSCPAWCRSRPSPAKPASAPRWPCSPPTRSSTRWAPASARAACAWKTWWRS